MNSAVCLVGILLFSAPRTAAQAESNSGRKILIEMESAEISSTLIEPNYRESVRNLPDNPKPQEREAGNLPCPAGARTPCASLVRHPDSSIASLKPEARRPRVADKKFWLLTAGSAGSSLLVTFAGIHCRHRNGVEPCTAHYGEFAATEGVKFGFSAIVIPAIAYAWKKNDEGSRHSKWWVFPVGVIAGNIGYAIREFNQGCNGPRLPNGGRCQ
jgi:hypothetical protein